MILVTFDFLVVPQNSLEWAQHPTAPDAPSNLRQPREPRARAVVPRAVRGEASAAISPAALRHSLTKEQEGGHAVMSPQGCLFSGTDPAAGGLPHDIDARLRALGYVD